MDTFDHKNIEKKWQARWKDSSLYKTKEDSAKPKTFVLDMFPYPSGEGLHVGHPKGYIATDIYSRFKRMQGHSVLHPMGWDAFGLPAENYAIKNKIHPRVAVEKNIATFKDQLSHIGFDYDWSREINTTDPEYYKWTQWIFLQLYKKGLAFQSNEPINWCPSCMTGLANEDLDGNECERCGTVVEKKALPQWVLKITDYADRMLADLDSLEWPEHIKTAQRNWIGRSEGAEIAFALTDAPQTKLTVFTTRPDTLFGATYLVLAPEHPLLHTLRLENTDEVRQYVAAAAKKTEIERAENKEKTGVLLRGVKAVNPANHEELPIFVADYVLGGYGTGAIMAVPAHDERDFAFAQKFNLPVQEVVNPVYVREDVLDRTDFVVKKKIVSIVEDGEGNVLTIQWGPTMGGTLFLGGSIEEGETPEQTALRELAEETGYCDAEVISVGGETFDYKYFASSKGVAYQAFTKFVHIKLRSLKQQEQKLEENEVGKFKVEWMPSHQVPTSVTEPLHIYGFNKFILKKPFTGSGTLANSGQFDGLRSDEAKSKITSFVDGRVTAKYKLKDWVFSRQRYWGEPIPIIHCPTHGAVAVPEDQLPVLLPEVESYEPSGTGESPLAIISEWVNTTCPTCGGPAKRETNTMPQWAGSSWYYLRFCDPHNNKALASKEKLDYWMGSGLPRQSLGGGGVDVYVGGDHAVRHLIYARFWHKFLYDIGVVSTIEPFARLEFLGFILAEDGRKMSKRYGNVINPTDVVATYGADAFRVYEMFMGPFENTVAWSTASIAGTTRFIERVWRLQDKVQSNDTAALNPLVHQTIKKVGEDIEVFKFNTAVSQMMILLNAIEKEGVIGREQWEMFLQLLSPFAPHTTEELWERLGRTESIHTSVWPIFDAARLVADRVVLAVQVNGKVRGTLEVALGAGEEEVLSAARTDAKIALWLAGGEERKALYVPGKIVSFVIDQKSG